MGTAQKEEAPAWVRQGEKLSEQPFRTPTPEELQAYHLECLEIVADWKEYLQRRHKRLVLRAEMIGGVDDEEVEELKRDHERLAHCMRVLAWRPADE